jgi:DNA polymerase-3 subunit chi
MTQISFYTLPSAAPEQRLHFICRLTDKAYSLGYRVHIHTESNEQAKTLDDLLWQFKATSFIPHRLSGEKADAEEAVTVGTELPNKQGGVLINLTSQACQAHDKYARINEIISADDVSLERGRKHYRFYKSQGYQVETFKL